MNILIATDVFPPKSGGSGWSTFHLARALQARGHHIEIVEPKSDLRRVQKRVYEGLDVVQVGYKDSTIPGLRAWQRTRALEETLSAYFAERAGEFDLVHAQHVLSISAAVAAKKMAPLRVVSTVRDYWAVCLYGTLWRDNAVCPICRPGQITRCLAQKYGAAARWMKPAVPLVERELARRQQALRQSDAVIAVSSFVASTLHGITDAGKLSIVPNLIDPVETQAQAASLPPPRDEPPYLAFVGKLNRFKGADMLPEILEKSGGDIPLVVAGDGELRADLERVRGIKLRGWLPNAETLALLARARALVFPSRWAEPFSRTLLEAQALGVPTVAWNSGGTRDIIQGNFNGWLADNVVDISSYVRRLVDDPEMRARFSENARRVAQEKFSPRAVVPQLESIYAGVIRSSLSVSSHL